MLPNMRNESGYCGVAPGGSFKFRHFTTSVTFVSAGGTPVRPSVDVVDCDCAVMRLPRSSGLATRMRLNPFASAATFAQE